MLDVGIIGAGVAGCRLASHLDKDYLVFERSKEVGIKDSGHVSERFFTLYPDVKPIVRNDCIEIIGRKEKAVVEKEGLTYIIDRERFGKQIRKGIEIAYEAVVSISARSGYFLITTTEDTYKARVLVGADGANSIVRRFLGIRPPSMLVGIFGFSKKRKPVRVYLDKSISSDFLAWRTPIGEYGLADSKRPNLPELERRENVKLRNLHGGLIPIGMTRMEKGKAYLVGDSAGMVKPITGGGIVYSTMAADLLAEHLKTGKPYEARIRKIFGREIFMGMLFRRIYSMLPQWAIDRMVAMLSFKGVDFDYDFLASLLKPLAKYKMKEVWRWASRGGKSQS